MSTLIDQALADRGVDRLYTWAENNDQYRFNLFMGFSPTGEEVVFDPPYIRTVHEFVKVLR